MAGTDQIGEITMPLRLLSHGHLLTSIRLALCALLVAAAFPARAVELNKTVEFNIPAQPLATALIRFAQQTNLQVVTSGQNVAGVKSVAISGRLSVAEALKQMLSGTGFTFNTVGEGTVSVVAKSESASADGGAAGENLRLARSEGQSSADAKAEEPASSASTKDQPQEIIVTATKRAERVQDIPMSIAVIGHEDIERRGLAGMEDYLRSIPGVNQIDRGGADNAIVIRGISTAPQSENFSSGTTVASYFDETPITGAAGFASGGIDLRPVDIERIEVLRGPQGTAYGAASLGGTLRIIPVKPKLDGFGARLAVAYSDTSGLGSDNSMIQGVVNLPLVADRFAVRLVGYRYDDSGFYRNIAGVDPQQIAIAESRGLGDFVRGPVRDDVGRMVSTGGRLAASWRATDKLDVSMTFLTQTIEQDGAPLAMVGEFDQSRAPVAPQGRVRNESGDTQDSQIDLANVVVNYDFGWGMLTSAASWLDSGSTYTVGAESIFAALGAPGSSTAPSDYQAKTAEIRVASQLQGRLQFLGGVFYEDVEDAYRATRDWPGTPATNPFVTQPMLTYFGDRKLDHRAIFGEVSYALTDTLTATVGGRYFRYEKDERTLQEGGLLGLVGGVPRVPIGGGIAQLRNNTEGDSSFKANLSYRPTRDALVYASWAQGFRLGRLDAGVPPASCDTNADGLIDGTTITVESTRSVKSDSLENYEIGGKVTLFDRRLAIDAAVYHIDWTGLPILTTPRLFCAYTANAGAATSDGAEFQASLHVAGGLRIDFGGSYTDAELSRPGLGAPEGARLPGSPKVNANLGAQYEFTIAGHPAFVRADSFYTGEFYGNLLETPVTKAGDYIKVDARAGVMIRNLSAELFVRNLTNEDEYTWRGTTAREPFYGYRLRPRTIGVQLGYAF